MRAARLTAQSKQVEPLLRRVHGCHRAASIQVGRIIEKRRRAKAVVIDHDGYKTRICVDTHSWQAFPDRMAAGPAVHEDNVTLRTANTLLKLIVGRVVLI